jgi:hypothetical protein
VGKEHNIMQDDDLKVEKAKSNRVAKDERLTVATSLVRSMLLQGSAAALEVQANAQRAGLLGDREQIGQSRLFRTVRKLLRVELHRQGFGPGSKIIWKLPGASPSIDEQPVDAKASDNRTDEQPEAAGVANERGPVAHGDDRAGSDEARSERRVPDVPLQGVEKLVDLDPAKVRVQEWSAALNRLDPNRPRRGIPPALWRGFLERCQAFVAAWGLRAAALKWRSGDLFAVDTTNPLNCGLVWMIGAGRVVELDREAAMILMPTGALKVYRRRPSNVAMALPWSGSP